MKLLLFAFIFFIFSNVSVLLAGCVDDGDGTWTSTPDRTSVASCASQALDGDTIDVTAGDGTETWTSGITISDATDLEIIGPGMDNLEPDFGACLYME